MKGNKVIVTGGKGFIGSALAYELVQQGADVHVVDICDTGARMA
jgi:nucleoside-diphosphate-sugar epimerase